MINKGNVHFDYGRWFFGWQWDHDNSWFYPFVWLEKEFRHFGLEQFWHDGPMNCFGFWFFDIQWRW